MLKKVFSVNINFIYNIKLNINKEAYCIPDII